MKSRAAQAYLEERGLEDAQLQEAFGLGFCDGSLLHAVPKSGDTREALIDLGILNDKGKEHFLGCVVVPLEHPELGIVGLYGRRISKQAVAVGRGSSQRFMLVRVDDANRP